jgi:hypothetical protein
LAEKRCWEITVEALKRKGVKYIFVLPGNPAALCDALYHDPEIEPVLVRQEASRAFQMFMKRLPTAVQYSAPVIGSSSTTSTWAR